jgi:leucyl/phenylalanyl-tRNA--protein transferase
MVLPVSEFKVSRSLRKTLRKFAATPGHEVRVDHAFDLVVTLCARTERHGQRGTWILPEMQEAYRAWHRQGEVHSFETWVNGRLVGGLYGVCQGRMFFGESMFSHESDASKIALAALVGFCQKHGIEVIDCQQETAHLESLGARPWPRERFEAHLRQVVDQPPPTEWSYDASEWLTDQPL